MWAWKKYGEHFPLQVDCECHDKQTSTEVVEASATNLTGDVRLWGKQRAIPKAGVVAYVGEGRKPEFSALSILVCLLFPVLHQNLQKSTAQIDPGPRSSTDLGRGGGGPRVCGIPTRPDSGVVAYALIQTSPSDSAFFLPRRSAWFSHGATNVSRYGAMSFCSCATPGGFMYIYTAGPFEMDSRSHIITRSLECVP
jgi:hypothetical protein